MNKTALALVMILVGVSGCKEYIRVKGENNPLPPAISKKKPPHPTGKQWASLQILRHPPREGGRWDGTVEYELLLSREMREYLARRCERLTVKPMPIGLGLPIFPIWFCTLLFTGGHVNFFAGINSRHQYEDAQIERIGWSAECRQGAPVAFTIEGVGGFVPLRVNLVNSTDGRGRIALDLKKYAEKGALMEYVRVNARCKSMDAKAPTLIVPGSSFKGLLNKG